MISFLAQLRVSVFIYLSKKHEKFERLKDSVFWDCFKWCSPVIHSLLALAFCSQRVFWGIHGEGSLRKFDEVWIWRFAPTKRRFDRNPKQKLIFFVTYCIWVDILVLKWWWNGNPVRLKLPGGGNIRKSNFQLLDSSFYSRTIEWPWMTHVGRMKHIIYIYIYVLKIRIYIWALSKKV